MGEEEDYMSDAFLKQLEDVKPGLCNGRKKKRETHKKHESLPKHKRSKLAENEAREQALSTPLSSDNKGFAMLKKMGYKEGTGLGKSGNGRIAPLPLVLKAGKVGLGREDFVRQQQAERRVEEAQSVSVFRQRKQERLCQKRVKMDLYKSQLACEQLDSKMGIFTAEEEWFWPLNAQATNSDEFEGDDEYREEEELLLEPSEQLETLTQYLRSKHFYCIWCGTAYEDGQDMAQHCPGDTAELHE